MVIGNGLVATGFSAYENQDRFLIFASGVSNSKSSTPDDFRRERELFISSIEKYSRKTAVYFSTTSVDDPDLRETSYIRHKLDMETLVKLRTTRHHIFRLSNLAGVSDNPNTILNFLYSHIANGESFDLWRSSERNIIDLADVFRVADHILQNGLFLNRVTNIANEKNYPLDYLVKSMETFTGKTAIFEERNKGGAFRIDISDILPICRSLKIGFGENYLPHLLEKYYPKNEL
jgi:nucleoside-diphosphate-sugar epimerase